MAYQETGLVKHTSREKIFLKINEQKEKRQEEWQKQSEIREKQRVGEKDLLKKIAKESPEEFYKMVFLREFDHKRLYDDTCFTLEELYECTDSEIEAFEEIVFRSVRSEFKNDILAALCIPIFGWVFGVGFLFLYFRSKDNRQFDGYHYLAYRKIARKKGISLVSIIREHIEAKRKNIPDVLTL